MAGKGGKWLMGCGLGCVTIVVLTIVIAAGGFFWLRGTMSGFDEAIETREALEERFGQGDEFVPWPDGAIPADRMEAFLRVHAAPGEQRERIAGFFRMLPDDPEEIEQLESSSFLDQLRFGLRVTRGGIGLAEHLSAFVRARNEALREADMGLGEYTYIYVTGFYSWLGHSPADEPDGMSGRVTVEGHDRPPERESGRWQTPRARSDFLAQLHSLRKSLDEAGDGADTRAWADRLSAEIDALDHDPRRIPWQDGLPEAIRVSLEPYRQRLEDGYSPATNLFELSRTKKRGMSIQAD